MVTCSNKHFEQKQSKILQKHWRGEVEMFLTQRCGDPSRQVTCSGTLDDIYAMSSLPSDWHLANEFRIHVIGSYPIFNLFLLIANLFSQSVGAPAILMLSLMTVPELEQKLFAANDLWKGAKVTHMTNKNWSSAIKGLIYETKTRV